MVFAHRNILTRVKDPVALEDRTGVVYSIPCHGFPVTYVGSMWDKLDFYLTTSMSTNRLSDVPTPQPLLLPNMPSAMATPVPGTRPQ